MALLFFFFFNLAISEELRYWWCKGWRVNAWYLEDRPHFLDFIENIVKTDIRLYKL